MQNRSEALCSTVLLLAGTYASSILPAAYKHGNLSYITSLYERHHLETEVEIAARAVA